MAFPLTEFRLMFPEFAAVDDDTVEAVADWALCYAEAQSCKCSDKSWQLLTAHLLALKGLGGEATGGPVTSASVGSVSVSFAAPASVDAWSSWLGGSGYGKQFLAMTAGCRTGFYVGGRAELRSLR